jgi:NRPS condensation-like uncharacterized protein
MDRVSPVNFAVVADVAGPLDGERLERAAARIQALHPLLRVRLDVEGGMLARSYRFRETDAPPEVRALSAEALTAEGLLHEVEAELARPFDVSRGPLFRLGVVRSAPDRHRLVLTMHHMIADGASAAIVLRDLLLACAAPKDDAVETRSLASVGPVFPGVPRVWALWILARLLARGVRHRLRRPVGRNVPGLRAAAAGRETGMFFHAFGRRDTDAVRAAAKAESTTVGGMLSAALARSVHRAAGIDGPAHVAVVNAVDVRGLVEPEARERVDLMMSFVVTYHRAGDGRPFFELARECAAAVKHAVARGDAVALHTLAGLLPSIEPGEAVRATIRVADRFATSAAITNVGRLDVPSVFGPFTIESVTFAPSLGFLGRFSGVAATFDQRLSWNFAYVKQVVGRELAEQLARGAVDDLLTHSAPWLPPA